MRSDFYHLDIFQWTKTGKKFAIFVFGRGEKFGFLAKIFTLEGYLGTQSSYKKSVNEQTDITMDKRSQGQADGRQSESYD